MGIKVHLWFPPGDPRWLSGRYRGWTCPEEFFVGDLPETPGGFPGECRGGQVQKKCPGYFLVWGTGDPPGEKTGIPGGGFDLNYWWRGLGREFGEELGLFQEFLPDVPDELPGLCVGYEHDAPGVGM